METSPPILPALVRTRDGRTEPFDPDKINQSLFTATEALGHPNAFLARELTDGILYFLPEAADGDVISTEQIEEVILKVVRELGHADLAPALAIRPTADTNPAQVGAMPADDALSVQAVNQVTPRQLQRHYGRRQVEAFALRHVFTRNLAAAHEEGLIRLADLSKPRELLAAVLHVPLATDAERAAVFEALEAARGYVGQTIALGNVDDALAVARVPSDAIADLVRDFDRAARNLDVRVILNVGTEDSGQDEKVAVAMPGFTFTAPSPADVYNVRLGILQALRRQEYQSVDLLWHLGGEDFGAACAAGLELLTGALAGRQPVTIAFHRPRRPFMLGPGIDAKNQRLLQWIDIDLRVLLQRHGKPADPATFAGKLLSVSRLAASAGVQKRRFIREHAFHGWPPFVIDRAHCGIRLVGMADALTAFFPAAAQAADAAAYMEELLQRLREALAAEAKVIHMPCIVDLPPGEVPAIQFGNDRNEWRAQLRNAGRLHHAVGRGQAVIYLPKGPTPEPDAFADLLHFTWRQTGVANLRFESPHHLCPT